MKIGIFGFGNFGQLAASILVKKFKVLVYEPKISDSAEQNAKRVKVKLTDVDTAAKCDVVILATPISKTEELIKTIAPVLKKKSLVIDTCSVKTLPARWMKKYLPRDVSILATHPMFGPYSTKFDFNKQTWDLKGLQLVLCPVRIGQGKLSLIKKYAEKMGLQVIVTTPEEHDRQTAMSLAFVHFLGRSIKKAGIREQPIYTRGFADVLKIYPHTNSDNWQLFYDMNNFNPYAKAIREKFMQACDFIDNKIEKSKTKNELEQYRNLVDKIDVRIIELLSQRFKLVKEIGKVKREAGKKVRDTKREKEIIAKGSKSAKIDNRFVKKLYRLIFDESYRRQ